MCGPLVASYSLQGALKPPSVLTIIKWVLPHVLYNAGRIMTYSFIGAMMGLTGSFMNSISGFRSLIPMIAGAAMIVMGVNITGLYGKTGWLEKHGAMITGAGKEILKEQSLWKYFILGSLFGFLPCGLSYSVFIAAAGTGSLVSGMLLCLLFGMGTLPWLLLFGVAATYVGSRLRGVVYNVAGVIVILMGIFFIVKGIVIHA
jgi:sulfite exporter TauE/SafE